MTIYHLHTNEGNCYVESTPIRLRQKMYEYIREKRAKGYSLSEIIFCWGQITVGRI